MRLNHTNTLPGNKWLFAYWANNRGRGRNNCTLLVVPANSERPAYSRDVIGCYAKTRTSSWTGDVNVSKFVLAKLGIAQKTDIIIGVDLTPVTEAKS